ncbi:type II toxin-antitoxin system VapC family toxin [Pelovirga terrestris]|uniref:Ribonuclease VapC n=1 Tax=Pelovirga terrestris TaxID=2771352 RepID=A0A8J6QY14_9BACT|nr:type II toxin-antitoxin system VapC family toxin [Pelovirga terrestris]MBD1400893.1 type II toxin-antitoxin system VapC family toxin [Pelovirga terrestris]
MYLIDTNVVSELRKARAGKADPNVVRWADSVDASELYLSVISVQELEIGVLLVERRDAVQGAMLRTWLNDHVLPAFTGRIIPVDTRVALRSAQMHVPDPHPVRDGLIAATALVHGMTIVTRNVDDFIRTGGMVLNPWGSAMEGSTSARGKLS